MKKTLFSILLIVGLNPSQKAIDLPVTTDEMGDTTEILNQITPTRNRERSIEQEREEDLKDVRQREMELDEETRRDTLGNQNGQGYL